MSRTFFVSCMNVIFLLGFLLVFQPARAQRNFSEFTAALESRQKILGTDVAVLVWSKDSLQYKKELGLFNTKTQAPIASCSKWLTAALVLMMADEGKISLDDKVVKYLPEFGKYFKSYITIRHCLSHMTGIDEDERLLKRLLDRKKFSSLEEEVNSYAARDIRANTGTDFWYGSIGLNIAARVLEIATKKKFETLIKTKLLTPLGMGRTNFNNLSGGPVNPSGGAVSTADDYMKFLVMLLNNGMHNGKRILSETAMEEMRKVMTNASMIRYAPKSAEGYNYAAGAWVMEEKDGVAQVLASPGLFGSWPMVDFCRGYAYLVFVKNLLGEEKARIHQELKSLVDEQFPSACE